MCAIKDNAVMHLICDHLVVAISIFISFSFKYADALLKQNGSGGPFYDKARSNLSGNVRAQKGSPSEIATNTILTDPFASITYPPIRY